MAICQSNLVLAEDGESYFGALPAFLVQMSTIFLIYIKKKYLCPKFKDDTYVNIFLYYTYLMTVLGVFYAENYIEYRQLFVGFISLHVPILLWLFYKPSVFEGVMSRWYYFSWIPFFILFFSKLGFVETYWDPILILLCLFPLFKKPYAIIILIIASLYIFRNIEEDRSPFIKGVVAFTVGLGVGLRNVISNKIIRVVHVLAYLSVVFLFIYIFADLFIVISGKADASEVVAANRTRDKAYKDTRSLLYIDVLYSSIEHNYFIWGHTPARGFEVQYSSGLFLNENTFLNKDERHKNEMVMSNIYTWEGLIGLFFFSLIYFHGSCLAVYHSKNKIVPFIGCFIAWRWAWGWVQDVNNLLCTDIGLWALMAICYSSHFREMSDYEFRLWARSLLSNKSRRAFHKLKKS